MAYTTTQLADAVLADLGVTDASETPDTADRTKVTDKYTAWHHEQSAHGNETTYWAVSEIPNPVFAILTDLMVLECSAAFGKPIPVAEKDAYVQAVMRRLRRHISVQSAGDRVQPDYF